MPRLVWKDTATFIWKNITSWIWKDFNDIKYGANVRVIFTSTNPAILYSGSKPNVTMSEIGA